MKQVSVPISFKKGFTLIEMMLVVAIMSFIAGLSAPIYQSYQVKSSLDSSVNIISQSLKRAQILSQSAEGNSSWGVHIATGKVVIFKGENYITRDSSFDEIFDLSESITPSGISEIAYSKLFGEPNLAGNIVLTTSNGDSKNINVNSKGTIEF